MAMRELRVEDALLYLDQVKLEFGNRPHIYNEFLDIMKTFKTQQLDTPGVIRRVSNLFRGNRRLVLGFNTFLPEGYKIEIPNDGDGPPVAVFQAPGSTARYVLNDGLGPPIAITNNEGNNAKLPAGQLQQQQQQLQVPNNILGPNGGPGNMLSQMQNIPQHQQQQQQSQQQHQQQQEEAPKRKYSGQMQELPLQQGKRYKEDHDQHSQVLSSSAMGKAIAQSDQLGPVADQRNLAPAGVINDTSNGGQQQQPSSRKNLLGQPTDARLPQQELPNLPVSGGQLQQPQVQQQQQQQPLQAQSGGNDPQTPLEFDHAINYVTTIKKRFSSEPETYKKFLEILHTYQKEQRGIREVLDDVSTLFADHPDLLKEFTFFLPDAVQAQAKAQLDAVAKEAETRKRLQAQKAISQQAQGMQRQAAVAQQAPAPSRLTAPVHPNNALPSSEGVVRSPRMAEREAQLSLSANFGDVSFSPVRPPRKGEPTPLQASMKHGRPTSIPEASHVVTAAERAFFEKAKQHLTRRELSSDNKLARRHTPHSEFLKVLHLFSAGILTKEELVLLLRGLFMQGHAPKTGANAGGGYANPEIATEAASLIHDLEEIFISRGPYAEQQQHMKTKSKYGGQVLRDIDFTNSPEITPSYRTVPPEYPEALLNTHSGQTEMDASVLNSSIVCVGINHGKKHTVSIEQYDGIKKRHNVYEEAMFRVEDERFEVDMAIERNAQAVKTLERYAEEATKLKEQEENDGQPIGRMCYQLHRNSMNALHINSIARVYGDRGDEVLQHLVRNQLVVLPIVYNRLKQKDAEWRDQKVAINERWNSITESNYEGSRDVLCYFYRREMEQSFSKNYMLDECKSAKMYCKSGTRSVKHPALETYAPTFKCKSNDTGAYLYQPHISVKCEGSRCHKDAFRLIQACINASPGSTDLDKDRVSRIWAEFIFPFFGYPIEWYDVDFIQRRIGKVGQSFVKYVTGQDVMTVYGEGHVISFTPQSESSSPVYKIKLPFGTGYLRPSAILYLIQSKSVPHVRRDGVMVRDVRSESPSSVRLAKKYQLLFGTETIYLFLRRYVLLCSILEDLGMYCAELGICVDPSTQYTTPYENGNKKLEYSLDYRGILAALDHSVTKRLDGKGLESIGRTVLKDAVYLAAALPKLIERCADSLLKASREDAILQIHDFCQFREVDPVHIRTQCFSMASDAVYRVQFDNDSKEIAFCYLPKNVELALVQPPVDISNHADTGDDAMDEDNGDDDVETNFRGNKNTAYLQGGPPTAE